MCAERKYSSSGNLEASLPDSSLFFAVSVSASPSRVCAKYVCPSLLKRVACFVQRPRKKDALSLLSPWSFFACARRPPFRATFLSNYCFICVPLCCGRA